MTAHISKPFVHVEDSNGNPYVAAKLYVYDVGTTNLKTIYSNAGLSVSVTNPLTSNASGDFDRVYIASGTYKLRAETAAAALIWEVDNIDTGLTSGSGALAISAGGTSATTAAAARTALGAAAQTDVDDLAADITTLTASLQNLVSVPQGRLCLVTATPVPAADVSAGTSVYYTPYIGNQIPLWDGSQYNLETFAELTLTMNANHLANQIYDVFVWDESNVITIGTGPAWNTATAGSGARGAGAGTTQISRQGGIWVNTVEITARNGATTYTVNANRGTYVGTILVDGSNGQISQHVTVGQSRKPGPWNAYNRIRRELLATDATATWNYGTNTIRASNGDSNNKVTTLCGLPDESVFCFFRQVLGNSVASTAGYSVIGLGINSTTAMSGMLGVHYVSIGGGITVETRATVTASHTVNPIIGINNIQACETIPTTTGTETQYGTANYMILSAQWGA
jgi:hypothetical protein